MSESVPVFLGISQNTCPLCGTEVIPAERAAKQQIAVSPEDFAQAIDDACAKRLGITRAQIRGVQRLRPYVQARKIAWRIMSMSGFTSSEIARIYKRDHTSVLYGIKTCVDHVKHDARFRMLFQNVVNDLSAENWQIGGGE